MSKKDLIHISVGAVAPVSKKGLPLFGKGQHWENRLRLINLIAFIIFFFNCFINYFGGLLYSFYVTLAGCVITALLHFLISDKNERIWKSLYLLGMNLLIVFLNKVEGFEGGNYLYHFLFLVIAGFIFQPSDKTGIIFSYLITMLCLSASLFLTDKISPIQHISEEYLETNFYINAYIAFLCGCALSFFMIRDIYQKRKSLLEKVELLNKLQNDLPDAVLIVKSSGMQISDCNSRAIELFGREKKSLLSQRIDDIVWLINPVDPNLPRISSFFSWQGEAQALGASGKPFPAYVSVISYKDGGVDHKRISILDLTEVKEAQEQLTVALDRAEKAANAKSVFLSNVSHELRTPLNGIIGSVNLMLEEAAERGNMDQHLNVVRYSSEHMLRLINEVLDFSKLEAGMMEVNRIAFNPANMIEGVASYFRQIAAEKHIALSYSIDPKLRSSYCSDEAKISQILTNLLSNAVKFTAPSGKVSLSAKVSQSADGQSHLTVDVKDTGIGIPFEKQEYIFEGFSKADASTSRRFGGNGLGLSISQRLANLLGCTISVQSEPGKGSHFYFSVPLTENIRISQHSKNISTPRLEGMRLLLVEDNSVNMQVALRFLSKWGIDVYTANNGLEAVDAFSKNEVDLLLVDLEMPVMDGYEALKQIRQINPNMPAIAFTASIFDNMHDVLRKKGFNDCLQKPFRPQELYDKIAGFYKSAEEPCL